MLPRVKRRTAQPDDPEPVEGVPTRARPEGAAETSMKTKVIWIPIRNCAFRTEARVRLRMKRPRSLPVAARCQARSWASGRRRDLSQSALQRRSVAWQRGALPLAFARTARTHGALPWGAPTARRPWAWRSPDAQALGLDAPTGRTHGAHPRGAPTGRTHGALPRHAGRGLGEQVSQLGGQLSQGQARESGKPPGFLRRDAMRNSAQQDMALTKTDNRSPPRRLGGKGALRNPCDSVRIRAVSCVRLRGPGQPRFASASGLRARPGLLALSAGRGTMAARRTVVWATGSAGGAPVRSGRRDPAGRSCPPPPKAERRARGTHM